MVVLDAEFTFYLASDLAPLEASWSRAPLGPATSPIPEVIIVSIALPSTPPDPFRRNYEYMPPARDEDFSPATLEYIDRVKAMLGSGPQFGGAETFLRVLRDEILPWVARVYRTDATPRILFGVSASGCFAAYTLFTEPRLFTDYLIVSPGLPEEIFRMEAAWAEHHDDLPARVLLTAGEKEIHDPLGIVSGTARLSELINSRAYPSVRLVTWFIAEATHIQTAAPSISRGLMELGRPLK
jgi:predicted alpha/beta superfamily hydrolase